MSPLSLPELSGQGIVLRRWRHSDLPAVADASTDPYIPAITSVPAIYSEEEGLAWLRRQEAHLDRGTAYPFAVSERLESIALGFLGLFISADDCWEAGYWVRPSARGRGIAAAALRLATGWARDHARARCIELQIEPWNVASRRIAERAGYVLQGERLGVEVHGVTRDFLVFVHNLGEPE